MLHKNAGTIFKKTSIVFRAGSFYEDFLPRSVAILMWIEVGIIPYNQN